MANAKIEFKVGDITFTGEGEEKWVASQLEKILDKASTLAKRPPQSDGENNGDGDEQVTDNAVGTLASFLQKCGATSNQTKRFLATAEWLTKKGTKKPTTAQVSKSLKDNHQTKLGNPADCLNKNVSKGYCEKDGSGFFVTPDGRKSLGQ